jgi:hypothetical protein
MASLAAPVEVARPRRPPRYYVFRLRENRHGGEPLIDIVAGPMTDLIVAWRAAGNYRKFYHSSGADPSAGGTFIAGDMDTVV